MGCCVTFLFLQTGYASTADYSGSLRLKYEYQHFVIKNIDIFIDEENSENSENETNISNSDIEFCFAEDIEKNVIQEKQDKFIIQNNLLQSIEKDSIIKNIENNSDSNNSNAVR